MTLSTIQNAFVGGEISPSLFGRTDLSKWHNGASTMRNFFANYRGGAASRGGTAFIGRCKQPGTEAPPRDINFQFNINQGYALEFGDQYMRVKYNGAYILESGLAITAISNSNPGSFTYSNPLTDASLVNDDWIYISGVEGMENFNGMTWIVFGVVGNTFNVKDLFGNPVDTTTFNAYVSGGTLSRVYTTVAPYAAIDLPYLKYTQSADTMSLTCYNQRTFSEYVAYDLQRLAADNWIFIPVTFGTNIAPPIGLVATANSSTTLSTFYSYVVTAVDAITGQESVQSQPVSVHNNNISINAGSNNIKWSAVAGASVYNIYTATPSYGVDVPLGAQYGFIGSSLSTNFTDTNIIANFASPPPIHNNPFARGSITAVTPTDPGAGLTQASIGYNITTSTGSGFVGTPIVTNGLFTAFVVENGGEGYAVGDTITITSGGTAASGTFTFTTNPTQAPVHVVPKTVIINGKTVFFGPGRSATVGLNVSTIGADTAATVANLANFLNASSRVEWSVASYTANGNVLTISYRTAGTAGNSFTLTNGTSSGVRSGATLTGGSATAGPNGAASLAIGPQTGTYPGDVAYYQQRRVYANTINEPDSYFMSRPGWYLNMDSSIPSTDSDAIFGTPWAQQINGIQHMQPMTTGLIILTGNGAWLLNGGSSAAITPSNQTATSQAYNGCHSTVRPIVVNLNILYVQSKGSIVRDLSYNFFNNIFTGTDITVLANHLFNFHQVIQWAYAEEPYKLVWAIRDDGTMLSLTYLKEQDVYAWARHDTNGFYVGVCTVTEPPVDAVYVIVKRYVSGQWAYYSERMDNRNWQNVEDAFCVDAGLKYPFTYPNATLTPSASRGTNNISRVNIIAGGGGYTDPVISAIDGDGSGFGAEFSVTLTAGVITDVTVITGGEGFTPGDTQLIVTDATGSGAVLQPIVTNIIEFTADASVFTSDNVGDVIRIGNNNAGTEAGVTENGYGRAVITSFISGTQIEANLTLPITSVIPNNPTNQPTPAISGQWSISTPTTIVRGLNHLEGMRVAVLADGSVVDNKVVSGGQITLPQAASAIVVGLPYTCQLQTLFLDPPGQPSTIQGKRKNLYSAVIRVENSRGIAVGSNQPDASTQVNGATPEWRGLIQIKERNNLVNAGAEIPLFTKDFYINIPANWSEKGQLSIEQIFPLPANISACILNYALGDSSG